jgi:two-component system phosphate regulon response regulator PhoB
MNATSNLRILIVEGEKDVMDMLTLNLRKAGFTVTTARDGAEGLRKAREERPALIIVDLMLPRKPGHEVAKILKSDSATKDIPIIMLTGNAEHSDGNVGSEFRADDYVTKPFSAREIVRRVEAILRRGTGLDGADETMTAGAISVDPTRHHVTVGGRPVRLTSVEFKLLAMLMKRRGRVQARDRLLNEVWGYESAIATRTVDTHVRRLRKKLGKAAHAIETVRGFGYRLREP